MTVTINAVSGTGVVTTSDGSGIVKLQSNSVTTNALAWVNFAGASGTRNASYNVSSVTRNGTGDYTVNFANALSDTNYVAVQSTGDASLNGRFAFAYNAAPTTTTYRFITTTFAGSPTDFTYVACAIFGN
jgi:hypothetical protein